MYNNWTDLVGVDFPQENTSQRKKRKNKIVIINATFDLCTLFLNLKIMKRLLIKIVLVSAGIALIGYGMQKGMELDKLVAVFLGGALIGIASIK